MSASGLAVFDRTVHETHEWLQDLMYELTWADRQMVYKGYHIHDARGTDRLVASKSKRLDEKRQISTSPRNQPAI